MKVLTLYNLFDLPKHSHHTHYPRDFFLDLCLQRQLASPDFLVLLFLDGSQLLTQ
jgi:hypothetical protein